MLIFDNKIKNINTVLSRANKFYSRIQIEESIKIVSLIYLIRYYKVVKEVDSKNLNEIFKACSSLALKFLLDFETSTNFSFYEKDICRIINWNFFVSEETYNYYSGLVTSSVSTKESKCS